MFPLCAVLLFFLFSFFFFLDFFNIFCVWNLFGFTLRETYFTFIFRVEKSVWWAGLKALHFKSLYLEFFFPPNTPYLTLLSHKCQQMTRESIKAAKILLAISQTLVWYHQSSIIHELVAETHVSQVTHSCLATTLMIVLMHTCLPLAAMHHHHNLKIAVSGQHRLIWGIILYFYRSETTSGSEHNFAQMHTVPLAANKCAAVVILDLYTRPTSPVDTSKASVRPDYFHSTRRACTRALGYVSWLFCRHFVKTP